MSQGIRNPLHLGLPQRLRRARKAVKLGSFAVARRAGLAPQQVQRIEDGAIPHLHVVEAIARVLQVLPGSLAFSKPGESAHPAAGDAIQDGDVMRHNGVGERLRASREQAGLSAKALGRASGTSDTAVRKIETGGVVPGLDTVERLADALGVRPQWLAFAEGTER